MDSLANYGSDDEYEYDNSSRQNPDRSRARAAPAAAPTRRCDDTNYDDVTMDMSEDSYSGTDSPRLDITRGSREDSTRRSRGEPPYKKDDSRDDGRFSRRSPSQYSEGRRGLPGDAAGTSLSARDSSDRKDYEPERGRHRDEKDKDRHSSYRRDDKDKDRDRDRKHRGDDRRSSHSDRRRDRSRSRDKTSGSSRKRSPSGERDKSSRRHPSRSSDSSRRSNSQDRRSKRDSGDKSPTAGGSEYKPSYKVSRKLQAMEKMGLQIKTPDGSMATAQMLMQRSLAEQVEKVKNSTGIQLPKYYNPAVMNPLKYAEQIQKRKLLWGNKSKEAEGVGTPSAAETGKSCNKWQGTKFAQDNDGKVASKFMRLMGVKDPSQVQAPAAAEPAGDIVKKQEEMFEVMQAQYEVARATTHTMRGVGLGFSSFSRQY